jgi:hypothetical protein
MTYLDVLGKALSGPAIAKGASGGDGRPAGDPQPADAPVRPGYCGGSSSGARAASSAGRPRPRTAAAHRRQTSSRGCRA